MSYQPIGPASELWVTKELSTVTREVVVFEKRGRDSYTPIKIMRFTRGGLFHEWIKASERRIHDPFREPLNDDWYERVRNLSKSLTN